MKISSVLKLISGSLPAEEFAWEISGELALHAQGLAVHGGSAPVRITEDTDLFLDRPGLAVLCRLFAAGELTGAELAYTADVLAMAERVDFSDQDVASDLAECTDPEINGSLNSGVRCGEKTMSRDEAFYEAVAREVAQGHVRPGLWAKALSETSYDEQKAKARYIKLRVDALKVETTELQRANRADEKARANRLAKEHKHQEQNKKLEAAKQIEAQSNARLHWLNTRIEIIDLKLAEMKPRRRKVQAICSIFGSIAGLIVWYYYFDTPSEQLLLPAVAGAFCGFFTYHVLEIILARKSPHQMLVLERRQLCDERKLAASGGLADLIWAALGITLVFALILSRCS